MEPLMQHVKDWSDCSRCPIATKHKVFYRGPKTPYYLFIGEAPGRSESVLKKPFVGVSGKLLTKMIKEAGIPSKLCGFANTVACMPHDNNNNNGRFRQPNEDEINNCGERLTDLIECLLPSYYISVGKIARLSPPSGVTYSLDLDHPSFVLRRGGVNTYEYKHNRAALKKFYMETKPNG